jgi:hypothetical protein
MAEYLERSKRERATERKSMYDFVAINLVASTLHFFCSTLDLIPRLSLYI